MKCSICNYEFKLIQAQKIRDVEETVESLQVYCPCCFVPLENYPNSLRPKKIYKETKNE